MALLLPSSPTIQAGLPAKEPGLLANVHLPFTIVAATVFAGKPAPMYGLAHTV
ncbi:hypothetical protein SAMN05216307_2245 [Pseudomonas putida]|nr:hypothetical protein SAMN05216307_2245 [Pseudomonas putida]